MKSTFLKKTFIAASILATAGYASHALAHTAGATIDSAGNNASATDLAQVICFDDSNGSPDHILVEIQDLSPSVSGLLLSAQIFKDGHMTNTTDTVSGDASYSNSAILKGGEGEYIISVSKTKYGARDFNIRYHCETANGVHTGTSEIPIVLQFQ